MDKECVNEPTLVLANHKGRKDEHHFKYDHKPNNVDICEEYLPAHLAVARALQTRRQVKVLRKGEWFWLSIPFE
jgi:hypothetical protein